MAEEETLEGQEQQAQEGGDEFVGAFAEATGQAEPEEGPAPEAPEEGPEGEPQGEEPESEEAEEPAEAEPESAPSKLSYHELREKVENGQANQAELNDFVHRVKSWEGTLSAKDRQLQEYRNQLEQLQASQSGGQEGGSEQGGDQEGGGAQQLQQYKEQLAEEFGPETAESLVGMVEQRAREIAEEQTGQLQERYDPYAQAVQEAQAAAEEQEIREAHPDLDNLVQDYQSEASDIRAWIAEQPSYMQPAMQQALDQGSAAEVKDVLNRYKTERGLSQPAETQETEPAPKQQAKAKQATAVKSRSGGPPKGRAQNFDDAFAEAMQQRG